MKRVLKLAFDLHVQEDMRLSCETCSPFLASWPWMYVQGMLMGPNLPFGSLAGMATQTLCVCCWRCQRSVHPLGELMKASVVQNGRNR